MAHKHSKSKIGTLDEYVKANRKASREAEIAQYGRPLNFSRIHESKRTYNRKRIKADDKRHLPFDLYGATAAGIGI